MARKKLLIAAVVVGLFAAFLVYLYGQQQDEKVEQFTADEYTVDVAVASTNIPAGQRLNEERVTTKEVPRQFLPANPLMANDIEIYLGQPLGEEISAGDMILISDFSVDRAAQTLSGRIPSGERAMTIPVDAISGVAGLLEPGDRVDILGTFPVGQEDELIPDARGQQQEGYATMSLLQNVTLLAVGPRMSGTEEEVRGGGYSNVTLSLTPDEAELMIIAQTRGELSLLLRNREDVEQVSVEQTTLREVLEDLDMLNEERRERVERRPTPCPPGQERVDGECQDRIIIHR